MAKSLKATAIHESGHTVMAWLFNLDIAYVTVKGSPHLRWRNAPVISTATARQYWQRILVSAGGSTAEDVHKVGQKEKVSRMLWGLGHIQAVDGKDTDNDASHIRDLIGHVHANLTFGCTIYEWMHKQTTALLSLPAIKRAVRILARSLQ